ncbi:uncharacterized protein [Henckelia pumila]|uniref:uncharacterized protein n=1 Tax=Henckelia pumila TaxID=405737 RepID=UPI003C6DEDD6
MELTEGDGKSSLKDAVSTFVQESSKRMARTEIRMDILETHVAKMGVVLQSMETSIGQLVNALKDNNRGQFPKKIEVNPIEQCKVIELRSGKEVGAQEHAANVEKEKRFKKKVLDEQFAKFLEIFKKLHINIPFADALLQMPNYAKFLKEVMSRKRKLEEFETVNLTEECRASINSMSLSVFRNLELGEVKPTTIALQLADRSLTYPRGIIEDVLVKIDKFIFPVDFVVLDMEEDGNMPLILGRSFLATAEAKIDVKKGALTMGVDGEKVTFNVFKEAEKPSTEKVFLIEQSKKMECCCKVVSSVKLSRENNPKLVKMKKKKKQSMFKRVVEFVWRVKENEKNSNKSSEPG